MIKELRPAPIGYTILGAAIALHFLFPVTIVIHCPYTLAGIPWLLVGLVINGQASALLMKRKTTLVPFEKPSTLVVSGPFRYSRNPIYLSAVMIFLGIALLLGSLAAFLAPVALLIALDRMIIRHEERNLEATFGRDYLEYKSQVRRWL